MGSTLFLVAAFLPISFRVFPQPSPAQKLESINDAPGQWLAAQVLFALGTVVTIIGIALYAYYVRDESFAGLVLVSVALLTVGAVPWLWHLYARAADPAWFAEGSSSMWPYLVYFLATELGLVVFGVAILSASLPTWVGWVVIVGASLLTVLTVVLRDMAPLTFYFLTLLAGVMLLG